MKVFTSNWAKLWHGQGSGTLVLVDQVGQNLTESPCGATDGACTWGINKVSLVTFLLNPPLCSASYLACVFGVTMCVCEQCLQACAGHWCGLLSGGRTLPLPLNVFSWSKLTHRWDWSNSLSHLCCWSSPPGLEVQFCLVHLSVHPYVAPVSIKHKQTVVIFPSTDESPL